MIIFQPSAAEFSLHFFMRILNVAEKPSVAKGITEILAGGHANRVGSVSLLMMGWNSMCWRKVASLQFEGSQCDHLSIYERNSHEFIQHETCTYDFCAFHCAKEIIDVNFAKAGGILIMRCSIYHISTTIMINVLVSLVYVRDFILCAWVWVKYV